jgi:hypothetical protein
MLRTISRGSPEEEEELDPLRSECGNHGTVKGGENHQGKEKGFKYLNR